jgi:hypothetical protein
MKGVDVVEPGLELLEQFTSTVGLGAKFSHYVGKRRQASVRILPEFCRNIFVERPRHH